MVFYNDLLPTELWFEIYKTEHAQKLKRVNTEIKEISQELEIFCIGVEEMVQRGDYPSEIFDLVPVCDRKLSEFHQYIDMVVDEQQAQDQPWPRRRRFQRLYNDFDVWNFRNYFWMTHYKWSTANNELYYNIVLLQGKYLERATIHAPRRMRRS